MRIREKLLSIFVELNRSQKFYACSLYLVPFALISSILPFSYLKLSLLSGVILFGLLGVINDLLTIYKKIWETLLGKGAILTIYAFLTNISLAFSSQAINYIVGVEPSKLIYSISFLSILTIPLIIFIVSIIFLGVFFLVGQIYFFISLLANDLRKIEHLAPLFLKKSDHYPITTMIVRGTYISIFLGFIISAGENLSPAYDRFIQENASAFIYNFEAYSKSRCNLSEGEKVILINDKEIIVAKKLGAGNYTFKHTSCNAKISSNKSSKRDAVNGAPS